MKDYIVKIFVIEVALMTYLQNGRFTGEFRSVLSQQDKNKSCNIPLVVDENKLH